MVSIDQFDVIKTIGSGSFGKITLCRDNEQNDLYAVKTISKFTLSNLEDIKHVKEEREILERVSGYSFFPTLYWAFEDLENFYFVMPFLQGGDLYRRISMKHRHSSFEQRIIIAEIAFALQTLHSMDIVYGDLKPENIMFDGDGHVVLTDFGLSSQMKGKEYLKKRCGTMEYICPELFEDERYSKSIDFWAFGLIIYELITVRSYFNAGNKSSTEFYREMMNKPIDFKSCRELTYDQRDLCSRLVKRDYFERLDCWQTVMKHPLFDGLDWDVLKSRGYNMPTNCKNLAPTDTIHFSFDSSSRSSGDDKLPYSMYFLTFKGFKNFYYSIK
ncbi:MAG: serine/threonine-protein kinase [Janthinobacterium lividum]